MGSRRLLVGVTGVALALALAGCGSSGGTDAAPTTPPVDPAVKPYCDTVVRVQNEQISPQAGQGGVPAASATARKQVGDLVAVAPPEIAGEWRALGARPPPARPAPGRW